MRGRRRGDRPAVQLDVAVAIGLSIEGSQQALGQAASAFSERGASRMVMDLQRAITWEGILEEEEAIVPRKAVEDQPQDPQTQVNKTMN